MRTKTVLAVCSAVLTVTLLTASLPAAAAGGRPVARATAVAFTPIGIAKFVGEKAAGVLASKAAGFVFSQLGLNSLFPDSTVGELKELKNQLNDISKQINEVQQTVDGLVNDLEDKVLKDEMKSLNERGRLVKKVFDQYFKPMLDIGEEWKALQKVPGKEKEAAVKRAELIAARDAFYAKWDSYPYETTAGNIHDRLVAGEALAAKGRVLMRDGYVTAEDSAALRELYDKFAALEALGAWMEMERWIPSDPAPTRPTLPGNLASYEDTRQEWLSFTRVEHINLPPVIPEGVVIAVGANARTTNGAVMWLACSCEPGRRAYREACACRSR